MFKNNKKKNRSAKEEFTEEKLPKNRKQQFLDCLKVRFALLFKVGTILLLFLLPYIVLQVYRDFTMMGFGAQLAGNTITKDEYLQIEASVNMVTSAINIICLFIASFGFAGVTRILRQLIWSEPVFFRYDFIAGIKSNGKAYAVIFFLAGVVSAVDTIAGSTMFPVELLKYVPYAISVIFLLPVAMYMLSQIIVYKNSVGALLKNSCILYIKSFPVTLMFLCLLCIPMLAGFIPLVFIKYAVQVLIIIFGLPLYILGWLLYSFSRFDIFINKEQFPELYRRGIYTPAE